MGLGRQCQATGRTKAAPRLCTSHCHAHLAKAHGPPHPHFSTHLALPLPLASACMHARPPARASRTHGEGAEHHASPPTSPIETKQRQRQRPAGACMRACVCLPACATLRAAGQRGLRCARTTELARCGQLQPCGCTCTVQACSMQQYSVSFVYPALFLFKLRYIKVINVIIYSIKQYFTQLYTRAIEYILIQWQV